MESAKTRELNQNSNYQLHEHFENITHLPRANTTHAVTPRPRSSEKIKTSSWKDKIKEIG